MNKIVHSMLFTLMLILCVSNMYSATLILEGNKELIFSIPDGWNYSCYSDSIRVRGQGVKFNCTFKPFACATKFNTQKEVNEMVASLSGPYAMGSVEQKTSVIQIKGVLGAYASFTHAYPDEYKALTSGIIRFPGHIMNFKFYSNSLTSDKFNVGMEIITSLGYQNAKSKITTLNAPGNKWKIMFEAPPSHDSRGGIQKSGEYYYRSSSVDGFNISVDIEKAKVAGKGNSGCADYYWPILVKELVKNPKPVKSSGIRSLVSDIKQNTYVKAVVRKENDKQVLISYRICSEIGGESREVPNVNMYFEFQNMWINVHVSKYPFKASEQGLFDTFIESLVYKLSEDQE